MAGSRGPGRRYPAVPDEVGLLIGTEIPVGTAIGDDVAGYVAGLVVTNDISARDIQLPKTEFYEAKSYPAFTPTGPALVLLDADELRRFTDLRLKLSVNGETRQDRTVADTIYRPAETLRALARFQRLDPGDLVLTGTPVGTASPAPPKPLEIIGSLLPPTLNWSAPPPPGRTAPRSPCCRKPRAGANPCGTPSPNCSATSTDTRTCCMRSASADRTRSR
ncbi:fumarylacetoacetate hydrolase family protein [Amycolatopsis sp. H20-H5]|uniref:fumarylacetoacetate hydrolase family protein n=1 Tax=Amycolatopsis sp. H20-H5 TaxID=3046309 RepID=UPI002DB880C3|nr:fumarylacetoacetate hydrolase family protein [Amycolatopsis sp. H20-H5]MEC3975474.1 fumarylacetoacetate hydrolase family protein [Amycolatopsis sp. H20-H5]